MRLIDADALIQKRNHAKAYAPDMYVIGQGYVMDAPTISVAPVVRGEWVDTYADDKEIGDFVKHCSICHNAIIKGLSASLKYCPNCGCKMEGKP